MTNKLPNNWKLIRIKDAIDNDIRIFNKTSYHQENIRYIDISSVDNIKKIIIEAKLISKVNAPSRAKSILQKNDIIVSTVRPNLNAVAQVTEDYDGCIASSGFSVIRPLPDYSSCYLFLYLTSPLFIDKVNNLIQGAMYPAINNNDVKTTLIPIPNQNNDQEKIAKELLNKIKISQQMWEAAQKQEETVNALQDSILRKVFPYREGDKLPNGWNFVPFTQSIMKKNVAKKGILSSEYHDRGKYPVIDQGQSFIAGYSDNENYTIHIEEPVIIFGDHTRIIKYVDFDFIMGADGTKIIYPNTNIFIPKYFYFALKSRSIPNDGYGRHYKHLSKLLIPKPPTKKDQISIADNIENKINAIVSLRTIVQKQKDTMQVLPSAILRQTFTFN